MKIILLIGGVLIHLLGLSQCSNDNIFYTDLTPSAYGESEIVGCVWGGDYCTVDVILGETYTFSTCGASWDTELTLFNSTSGAALAFNDDACGVASEINWEATFTGTVHVLVDGSGCSDYFNCGGNLTVFWGYPPPVPANDLCANALELNCGDLANGTTTGANYDSVWGCGTSISAQGVWYSFEGNGEYVTVALCNSSYDTKINVYSGDCNNLECVTGNDDGCGSGSISGFFAISGINYFFYVQGYGNDTGDFEITLACEPYNSSLHQDCGGALTLCTDGTFDGNSEDYGGYQDLNGTNSDCLTTEHQSQWFIFSPITTGTIGFELTPSNGIDYDFAIWGPYDYEQIPCPPDETPLRCSYSALYEPTGLAADSGDNTEPPSGDAWVELISVSSSDLNLYYLMLIDNYTADNTSFEFEWNLDGVILNCALMLPVELISFEGKVHPDRNELIWKTASELNNSHFVIQRSMDGSYFEDIGEVLGQGTTANLTSYLFNDRSRPFGTSYYRLKQVDLNGEFEYLPMIVLDHEARAELLAIYPNPGKGVFACDLNLRHESTIQVSVCDLQGRELQRFSQLMEEGSNHFELNLAQYTPGTFVVVFSDEEGPFATERIIRKPN